MMGESTQLNVIEEVGLRPHLRPLQRRFLQAFAKSGNITLSCLAAGVSRSAHYMWFSHDSQYRVAFEKARQQAGEMLDELVHDLATGAYMRPIVSSGKVVCWEPIYDTRLLLTLLRANMPEK